MARLISRRTLLKSGASSAVGAGLLSRRTLAASAAQAAEAAVPRNIIFMVADGMSAGVPSLTETFSQMNAGKATHFARLATLPETTTGLVETASLNSPVTDSSAASSAWASGSRIFNGAVNMLPDGRPLQPFGPLVKASGRSFGLVTTTRITHATPAGFAATAASRDLEDDIAVQYLGTVDVLLGGGAKHFLPNKRPDRRDVFGEFRRGGYEICRTRDELINAAKRGNVLGVFYDDHLPFSIDRRRELPLQQQVPTLAEMTAVALQRLADRGNGFLLQIEGGRVDHAAHHNDAPALIHDQLAFDEAIAVALEFCREYPDTLLVITTDHGTGNPGLGGFGAKYERSGQYFERVIQAKASFEALHARWVQQAKTAGAPPDVNSVIESLKWASGLTIQSREADIIANVLSGREVAEVSLLQRNLEGVVGQVLGNHTGVYWTGITHTSDWAALLAIGSGRARFNGLMKNTDVYSHIAAMWGISHRNPAMMPEEAKRFSSFSRPRMDNVEAPTMAIA